MLVAGALGLVASGWLLGRQIGGPQGGRAFSRALATNLSIGLVALVLLEGAVRITARTTPDGHHLERQLGPAVPVLNFGVDGCGLDQTYLRCRRNVRGWKPRVVLISLMGHELLRTMAVYPFVSFRWPPCVVKPSWRQ